MKKLIITGIAVLAVSLILTCENGFSIIDEIETEVKISNGKFLVIKSVSPLDELTGVDPGTDITITFDRALDMDTVNSGTIIITDNAGNEKSWFNPVFENLTNTLTLKTYGLDTTTKHIISVSGLKGSDNSELQANNIWSFTTGVAPAGSLTLESKNPASQSEYTDDATVDAKLTYNEVATRYFISNDLSVLDGPPEENNPDWKVVSSVPFDHSLTGVEGENKVYVLFRYLNDQGAYVYSQIKEAEITLDRTPPVVDAGADVLSYTGFTRAANVTEINVKTMHWDRVDEDGPLLGDIDFSAPSSATTYVDHNSIDGDYIIRFTVVDKAGNSSFDEINYTVDTEPPGVPSISSPSSGSSSSTGLLWEWTAVSGDPSNYQCSFDSGTWDDYDILSLDYTYIIPRFTVGVGSKHTLRVRAEDAAGNLSSYDTYTISYFPSTDIYLMPDDGGIKISQSTNIDWPDFSGATGYLFYKKKSTAFNYETPVQVFTSFYNPPSNLLSDTTYNWYYKPYKLTTKNILGTSPVYSFTTIN